MHQTRLSKKLQPDEKVPKYIGSIVLWKISLIITSKHSLVMEGLGSQHIFQAYSYEKLDLWPDHNLITLIYFLSYSLVVTGYFYEVVTSYVYTTRYYTCTMVEI